MDRGFFTTDVHDEEQVGAALHRSRTRKTGGETGDLATDEQTFLFGQAIQLIVIAHLLQAFQLLDAGIHG
jgi:hypothetical protein